MTEPAFEIVLTPPARRAIAKELSARVAAAGIDFITTARLEDPHRGGQALHTDLDGSGPLAAGPIGCSTGSTRAGVRSWCS